MASVITLRESAIEAAFAAKAALDNPDSTKAEFEAHLTKFRSLERQHRAARGEDPNGPAVSVDDFLGQMTASPSGSPYGGYGGVAESGLPPFTGRPFSTRPNGSISLGAAFVEARQSRLGFGAVTPLLEPGSTAVTIPLRAEPYGDPRQAQFVFQLLPEEEASGGGLYSYMKQSLRDLRAAVVATGAVKPTSGMTFERIEDSTKVIAHLSEPIDRFILQDSQSVQIFLNIEMQYGLNLALDALVVAALLDEATAAGGSVNLTGIRSAITTLQVANYTPNAIVLSPASWQDVESEITTTYVSESDLVTEALSRRLFSLPVVVTNSINDNAALVGAFGGDSAVIKATGGVQIDVDASTTRTIDAVTATDFARNMLVVRAEFRRNIAVIQPTAFVVVGAGS